MADARDPLTDRLGPLHDVPVPPLMSPDAVRARGERRRRRTQAVAALAAVAVAAALGGSAALALGPPGPRDDALRVASPPSPTPASASPTASTPPPASPSASASPTASPEPSSLGTSSPAPTAAASASAPAPHPAPPRTWAPSDAFLTPEAASEAEFPGWVVEDDHPPRLPPGPVVDPCGADAYAAEPAAQAERAMTSTRDSGGSGLVQRVTRYADTAAAGRSFDDLTAAFLRCPEAPADDGGTFRYAVEATYGPGDPRAVLVSVVQCPADGCSATAYRSYVLLARSGDGVSEAHYGVSEDGTPRAQAEKLLAATLEYLATAQE